MPPQDPRSQVDPNSSRADDPKTTADAVVSAIPHSSSLPHSTQLDPNGPSLDPSEADSHRESVTVCDTECTSIDPESTGRFKLIRRLGKGGFGVVFLALDRKLNRQVALKVPRSDVLLTKGTVNRLMREALNAAKLDHPNIIPVLETDDSMGVPSIVYHYCDGPTLSQWRKNHQGSISAKIIATIGLHLAEAVQHAHSRGILHRDLKPSNILLEACPRESIHGFQDNDAAWVPRITDFGISKAIDVQESETLTGALMGTPEYMSPEQLACRNRDVGTHSDVYSLGVMLYELTTGNRPYHGRVSTELLMQIQKNEPATVRKIRDDIPKDLEAIILHCLSYDERQRYSSAAALAEDLRSFLDNRPVVARPPTRLGQWYRWAKRQPLTATLILCCMVLLTTAALLGWSHFRQTAHLVEELQKSNTAILKSRSQADQARDRATAIADEFRRTLYTTDMVDAFQALRDRDLPTYDSLLQKQLFGDDQDSRDAVWHYLWSQGHRKATQELATSKNLYSLRLSNSGDRAAICGVLGTVSIVDLETMKVLQEWNAGQGELNCAEFSPDDRYLATVGDDGHLHIWECSSAKREHSFRVHEDHAFQVAFLDDRSLITCGNDPVIRLWDMESGQEIGKLEAHTGSVQRFHLSEDRKTLVSGSDDWCVCVWDLATKSLVERLSDSEARVMDVESSDDLSWIVSADMGGQLRMRSKSKTAEKPTKRLLASHKDGIESVTASAERRVIAAGTRGGAIHIYSMSARRSSKNYRPGSDHELASWMAHEGRIYDLAFSEDGKFLYSVSEDGKFRKWNMDAPRYPRNFNVTEKKRKGSDKPTAMAQVSKDSCVFSAGANLYRWNAETGQEKLLASLEQPIHRVVASRDLQFLFTAQLDGSVIAWRLDANSLKKLWEYQWPGGKSLINGITYCEAGRFVVFSVEKPEIRMAAFRVDDGTQFMSWGAPETLSGNHEGALDVTTEGDLIAIGGGNDIGIWDFHGVKPELLQVHTNTVSSLAFSPDMKYLLAGSHDRTLSLWRVADWELAAHLRGHRQAIASVAWSDDGRLFASSGDHGETKIWHAEAWREMIDLSGPQETARIGGRWLLPRLFRAFRPHTLQADLFE